MVRLLVVFLKTKTKKHQKKGDQTPKKKELPKLPSQKKKKELTW
jgi:hypothetical protein